MIDKAQKRALFGRLLPFVKTPFLFYTRTMAELKPWQNHAVYQIYPRSFCDSNGDGIGDIPGIISKLDYLKDLGVGILWLSPVYASPNADYGYDVSDYRAINPDFGTMADMDRLIAEAKSRGIRIVMDLVVNHTSDEHKWFVESKKPTSPYRDYYYWKEGKSNNTLPPNNWTSNFGGSAWTYVPESGAWYLHIFGKKQPDLNWHNPKVLEEVEGILRFWLDKGIYGFRCDVINQILLGLLNFTLRGTPFIYEGEELGMLNYPYKEKPGEYKDVCCDFLAATFKKFHFPKHLAIKFIDVYNRDHARSPMQWDSTPNAGFSKTSGPCWLPLNPNYPNLNARLESLDSHSILAFYQKLTQLRLEHSALNLGSIVPLKGTSYVFAYRRQDEKESLLVLLNFSKKNRRIPQRLRPDGGTLLLSDYDDTSLTNLKKLRPFEALVLVEK
jgi:glycosidase